MRTRMRSLSKETVANLTLPEYVSTCFWCDGTGETIQTYTSGCGGGYYRSPGPCDVCGKGEMYYGVGFLYRGTTNPIPESVLNQIMEMNKECLTTSST